MLAGTWTVYRRELVSLFLGPLAWALLCVALFVNGYFFTRFLEGFAGDVHLSLMQAQGGFAFMILLVLLPPLLTMRMISEESRTGTLEYLLTAPVGDLAVVLGKMLAGTTVMLLLGLAPVVYGLTLSAVGGPPDWGQVLVGLIGGALISALFCAIGLVASAGTSTPILAAFLAFVFNVGLLSLPSLGGYFGVERDHWLVSALAQLDVLAHYQTSFLVGLLDTRQVVFFVAWIAFFVFLATRILETRRWRT